MFNFQEYTDRYNKLNLSRQNVTVVILLSMISTMIFNTAAFTILMINHKALTDKVDNNKLPAIILLVYVIWSIIANMTYFLAFMTNFDNPETKFSNWSNSIRGNGKFTKFASFFSLLVGFSLFVTAWVFICNGGGVDYSNFNQQYSSLAKMNLGYFIYTMVITIIGSFVTIFAMFQEGAYSAL